MDVRNASTTEEDTTLGEVDMGSPEKRARTDMVSPKDPLVPTRTNEDKEKKFDLASVDKKPTVSAPGKRAADGTFSCKLCGKSFVTKGVLNSHFDVIHLGIKNFRCSTCGKFFPTPSKLKRHVDGVHLGVKGHSCELCQKSFKQRGHLETHLMAVHAVSVRHLRTASASGSGGGVAKEEDAEESSSSRDTFDCVFCPSKFEQEEAMRRHVRGVHIGNKA